MTDIRTYDEKREQALIDTIESYWAGRGKEAIVKTRAATFIHNATTAPAIITSNIVNGWPQ